MKSKIISLFLLLNLGLTAERMPWRDIPEEKPKQNNCFTENKGQVGDQFSQPRPDILFGGYNGGMTFHLKKNGISYQQCRIDSWMETTEEKSERKIKLADKISIYRLDVNWLNCSSSPIIERGEELAGYSNFYSDVCPDGVSEVHSYASLVYKNIYDGIDLKWYFKNGQLKYDYILNAGADHSQIKLEFRGSKKMTIDAKGNLLIQTGLGSIIEEAPVVLQEGKKLKSGWIITGNVAAFRISGIDPAKPFVIDPGVRQWGTYYGGNQSDVAQGCTTDPSGNLYMVGYTTSPGGTVIATVGAHQATYSGSGLENAILVKFTPAGTRIWATYYGGNVREVGMACSTDNNGNVIMAGNSVSNNGTVIATAGSHQSIAGGNWDAFLVKFNSSGVRQWGTYYGGSGGDFGTACAASIDGSGDVYLGGRTDWSGGTVIATPGSHQFVYDNFVDGFLVKFNSAGVRQWGTYYGGEGSESVNFCLTDAGGNVYITGQTSSTAAIATPGAFKTLYANSNDMFLAKFNNSGIRQWCTYYGGQGDDRGTGISKDGSGNIYVSGKTSSSDGNSIATDGSHQNTFGGGNFDAFLVKFNSTASSRHWGTYYGGSGDDQGTGCAVNVLDYAYLVGMSASAGTIIATPGSHQPNNGGGTFDGFLSQFDVNGNRVWGTFYGDNTYDIANGVTIDNNSNVYFAGLTDITTGTAIATVGSHQSTYGGGSCDAFFVKFYDCASPPAPTNTTNPVNLSLCPGNSTTLNVSGFGTFSWFSVPSGGSSIGTGSTYVTPVLPNGTYTYYAQANTCTNSVVRTAIIVTVHPLPNIFTSTSNSVLCSGQTATLFASGVTSYSWSNGPNTNSTAVSPTVTTTYTISGTDQYGCVNSSTITQVVSICTGIENNLSAAEIKLYPNPSSGVFKIAGASSPSEIFVYNSMGQMILHDKSDQNIFELDLRNRPDGIYFIRVRHHEGDKTFSLLKQ